MVRGLKRQCHPFNHVGLKRGTIKRVDIPYRKSYIYSELIKEEHDENH